MRARLRILLLMLSAALAISAGAQKWASSYERGLANAKKAKWVDARKAFQDAMKDRPGDTEKASTVGGSITDRRPWRDGAAYTPAFAAAYCAFKAGMASQSSTERTALLNDSIKEFNALVESGKESLEALVFLATAQAAINDNTGSAATQARAQKLNVKTAFKVDREVISEDDLIAFQAVADPSLPPRVTPIEDPRVITTLPRPGSDVGLVPTLTYKYALLIGNQTGSGQAFAQTDVEAIKTSLVQDAGYPEENVVVLKEATAAQIQEAVKNLAEKMPESGILFFYFSGQGVYDGNTGKDYLAGIDSPTEIAYDTMVAKSDLFMPFVRKGCSIFSFFQCDRRIVDEKYFGLEVPQVGRISQCFGVLPGEFAQGLNIDGQFRGVYTAAVTAALKRLRNNRIGVLDFAWAVFDECRTGLGGAGGGQTPSLPVTTGLTGAAKF